MERAPLPTRTGAGGLFFQPCEAPHICGRFFRTLGHARPYPDIPARVSFESISGKICDIYSLTLDDPSGYEWHMELGLGSLVQGVWWLCKKARLTLPFPKERKAFWNLQDNCERIVAAIEEPENTHFEMELRSLYPRLEKYGLLVPIIEPVTIGEQTYDTTWKNFHLTFLKCLRRFIRDEEFNLEEWNIDVAKANGDRQHWIDTH